MRSTVLIIDDSPTMRHLARIYLSGLDLDLLEAEDGHQALLEIARAPVDLVIADLRMPRVDGLEFVQRLRADLDLRRARIPVVMMTMATEAGLREQLLGAGVNEYLVKPATNEALRGAVLKLLPVVKQ